VLHAVLFLFLFILRALQTLCMRQFSINYEPIQNRKIYITNNISLEIVGRQVPKRTSWVNCDVTDYIVMSCDELYCTSHMREVSRQLKAFSFN